MWESQVVSNTAQANPATSSGGYGGGLYIGEGTASLRQNLILDNLAHALWSGYGGGVYLQSLDHADVLTNVIEANRGNPPGSHYGSYGGGVYVNACPSMTLSGNLIMGNSSRSQGGGIFVDWSRPELARNRVMGNTSTAGAGIMIKGSMPVTLTNNLIVHNSATARAGGVLATNVTPPGPQVHLFNNTLADNEQAGVATWNYASLGLSLPTITSFGTVRIPSSVATHSSKCPDSPTTTTWVPVPRPSMLASTSPGSPSTSTATLAPGTWPGTSAPSRAPGIRCTCPCWRGTTRSH
jgi:hypothetical protein